MRLLMRLMSAVLLLATIAAGTIDAIRSVSLSRLALTSVRDVAMMAGAQGLSMVRFVEPATGQPAFWQSVARFLIEQPAFAVLAGASLVFFALGHRSVARISAAGNSARS